MGDHHLGGGVQGELRTSCVWQGPFHPGPLSWVSPLSS